VTIFDNKYGSQTKINYAITRKIFFTENVFISYIINELINIQEFWFDLLHYFTGMVLFLRQILFELLFFEWIRKRLGNFEEFKWNKSSYNFLLHHALQKLFFLMIFKFLLIVRFWYFFLFDFRNQFNLILRFLFPFEFLICLSPRNFFICLFIFVWYK